MTVSWPVKTTIVLAVGLGLATTTLPAAAADGATPSKWCGATNMIVASPMFTEMFGGGVTVSSGMDTAMGVDAQQGTAGMFGAVDHSGGAQSPTCTTP